MKLNKLISVFVVLTLIFLFSCKQEKKDIQGEKEILLFSFFKGDSKDGLHLAYSEDGLTWTELNNSSSFLIPDVGKDKLMRDPSIAQDKNGIFHMIWTTGWWDQGIGYAYSKDLINWSEQQNIPVMENYEGTKNCWAPELFFDADSDLFYIFWASTVEGLLPDLETIESEKGLNHRQYYTTTKDFKSFSETKLFYDPDFSVIDGIILKKDSLYYLFVKNENSLPAEKNIRFTSNNKPYDFPKETSAPITGDYWAEGPAVFQKDDYVYVYFDKYREHTFGAIRSKDMKEWTDISDSIKLPKGLRHGTIFKVNESIINILKEYSSKNSLSE